MLKKTTVWLLSVMMLVMLAVAGCGGGGLCFEGRKES